MNRGTGTGLIAFGIVLGVIGAIMAFAVTVEASGFNINTAGTILLVVGIIVLVIGIAIFMAGSRRSSTTVENVQSTPTGQERVEERRRVAPTAPCRSALGSSARSPHATAARSSSGSAWSHRAGGT